MKKLLVLLLAFTMLLSLAACEKPGETKPSAQKPGTTGGKDPTNNPNPSGNGDPTDGSKPPVTPGSYVYTPPTDNFYVETNTYIEARSGNYYTYWDKEDTYYSYHVNYELKGVWEYYDGDWHLSEYYEYDQYEQMRDDPPYIFSYMEDGLLAYLRMFCDTEEELNAELQEYYLGEETVAGVKCHIYDSKGFNTLRCKYWIDPANGCVLKYDHYQEEDFKEELLVYDLNYTQFGAQLRPEEYEDPCGQHWDENADGICDRCERPFTRQQLDAPEISIADDGRLTWYVEGLNSKTIGYLVSVNGVETETNRLYLSEKPHHGDVIKVKALADPNGPYLDSQWSAEFTFRYSQDYEFLNIGLTGEQEEALVKFFEDFKPGSYYLFGELNAYKCANGDLIIWEDSGSHQIYNLEAYHYYKLHHRNDEKHNYDMYNYASNKKEFYTALWSNITLFSLCTVEEGNVYANSADFLQDLGITLLGPDQINVEDPKRYELLNYREYSSTVDKKYIHTGYMDPDTRYFEYLSEFGDKVLYWEVNYINSPLVYVEGKVFIQFTADFDHTDYEKLRSILISKGVGNRYGQEFGPVNENNYNSLDGIKPVFCMPFEHEGDNWYDDYTIVGFTDKDSGMSFPYSMSVEYLYSYWYDGGSFATYVRRRDGLWRFVDEQAWLMIGPDGTVYEYDFETGLPK